MGVNTRFFSDSSFSCAKDAQMETTWLRTVPGLPYLTSKDLRLSAQPEAVGSLVVPETDAAEVCGTEPQKAASYLPAEIPDFSSQVFLPAVPC
jgi:hypothetical protein